MVVPGLSPINMDALPKHSRVPLTVALSLSYRCNLKCTFCYAKTDSVNDAEPLSLESLDIIVDKCVAAGICIFSILGGEPTAHWREIEHILSRVDGRMYTSLVSNGSYGGGLSEERAEFLASWPRNEYHLTLHSMDARIHDDMVGRSGAWACTSRSLRHAIGVGVTTIVHAVVTRRNLDTLGEWARHMKECGARAVLLLYQMPRCGQTKEEYFRMAAGPDEYLTALDEVRELETKEFSVIADSHYKFLRSPRRETRLAATGLRRIALQCAGRELDANVSPEGGVYPCPMTLGMEDWCLGNLLLEEWPTIWRSAPLARLRDRQPDRVQNAACRDCEYLTECIGGCPVSAMFLAGDEYAGDPACPRIIAADRSARQSGPRDHAVCQSPIGGGAEAHEQ
jgi:radical SAM protein with 4Fe4S-binding SPASM domain